MTVQYSGHWSQRFGHISYAQHGEDFLLLNLFDLLGIKQGGYLDLGAHHPDTISNTALLYERGWRGVNVEPNKTLIGYFHEYRPLDVNLCIGVAGQEGTKSLYSYDSLSPCNTMSEEERDRYLLDHVGSSVTQVQEVPTLTINQIVETYFWNKWPYLITMDIEGLDYEVLESMKLPEYFTNRPHVFCIEVRREESDRFKRLMETYGYVCLIRVISNLIFIRSDHSVLLTG